MNDRISQLRVKGKCTKFGVITFLMCPVPRSSGVNDKEVTVKSKHVKNLQSYRWLNPVTVAYHFSKINTPKLLQITPA